MNKIEDKKCPNYGGEMEKGYFVTRMASWSDKKISSWSLKGLWSGEIVLSRGYPYPFVNVEASRCKECKLILFQYGASQDG
jgi:hypothetical protein